MMHFSVKDLKVLLLCTAVCVSVFADGPVETYQEIQDAAVYPILNPALAKRESAKLQLANGLQVYLISDPGAKQSAAAVCVGAGSWHDPKEYPGMAHFLEHMLFMGTGAYPEEFEYMQYISDHGGKVNASTWPDRTIYMFSINNDAFSGALDRFSHFFIDPLFLTSCIERELHAVDQEHAKNVENDGWRQYMVFKETGNPLHPNAGFSTGNAKTLGGIPQAALKNWYESHYSSEKMHLVVFSPLPMEDLKTQVLETFTRVPEREVDLLPLPDQLSSAEQRGHMIFLQPIKDLRSLSLMWEVPEIFADWERQPSAIVAYILNSEAENSLIAELKREKLAESLKATPDLHGKGKLLFTIDIDLTPQGVAQTEQVITRVFQALAKLKERPIPSYLFDEMQKMAILNYQYQSREDAFSFITRHAHDIYDEALETYPEKKSIPSTFDPAFLASFLSSLTPETCIYFLEADPKKVSIIPDRKEKWMGAEYAVRAVPREKLALWAKIAPHPRISLPEPNPFLPDLSTFATVGEVDETTVIPKLVMDDEWGKVYWAEDHTYLVPEVFASFSLKTPLVDGSPKAECCGDLYIKALDDALSSTLSHAQRAGMNTAFEFDDLKFSISLYGYHFKAALLLKEIFAQLRVVQPTKEQFEIFKHSLMSSYENRGKDLPVVQASELLDSILYNDAPTSSEKASVLREVTYEDFLAYCKAIFKTGFAEGLVYGNLSSSQVETLCEEIKGMTTPLPVSEQHKAELLLLPDTRGPHLITQTTPRQGNGVILLLEQGAFTFEKRAAQEILATVLKESFFDTLRTKQQTAYIAKAWAVERERQLLQFFAVQSSTHHPSDLIGRFELFLEDFLGKFHSALPRTRFEEMRKMHIETLQMVPENLFVMGKRLTQLAFEYDGDFNWIERKIDATSALSYERLQSFTKEFLSRSNLRRLAILMEGVTSREHDFHYAPVSKEEIADMGTYTSNKR
ncbi:MAG: insulinase family protein [Chlamydiales bacterium]